MHKPITDKEVANIAKNIKRDELLPGFSLLIGGFVVRIQADAKTIAELRDRVKVLDDKNEVLEAEITDIYQDWGN